MPLHSYISYIYINIPVVVISSTSTLTDIGQQYNGLLICRTGSIGPSPSCILNRDFINPTMISTKHQTTGK